MNPDLPPLPADHARAIVQVAKKNIAGANRLRDSLVNGDGGNPKFRFIMARILEYLSREVHRLVLDTDTTLSEIAWSARNILELRVWAKYVCESELNLDRFENDWILDALGTFTSSIDLFKQAAPGLSIRVRLKEQVEELERARRQAGLDGERHLSTSKIAERLGLGVQFSKFNQLTSKLVHPTAWSILKTFDMDLLRDTLVHPALILSFDIVTEARQHIDAHGMRPG